MTESYFGNADLVVSLREVHPVSRRAQPKEIAAWSRWRV